MEELGFNVRVAHDGEVALREAVAFQPDVVLLDIGLAKMDGYQVARAIRRNPLVSQPMLIAVTGYGRDNDRYKSRDAGFDHHLVKPIDIDDVLDAIESIKLSAISTDPALVGPSALNDGQSGSKGCPPRRLGRADDGQPPGFRKLTLTRLPSDA
jgi:DNA-binding response OmpR family regulator